MKSESVLPARFFRKIILASAIVTLLLPIFGAIVAIVIIAIFKKRTPVTFYFLLAFSLLLSVSSLMFWSSLGGNPKYWMGDYYEHLASILFS